MMTTRERNALQKKLHALRASLDARSSQLRGEAFHGAAGENAGDLSNVPLHPADVGSQEMEAAVNLGLAENEAMLRREIDEALERLEAGGFGRCEECGRDIGRERLEAIPFSRYCIHCAEKGERARAT